MAPKLWVDGGKLRADGGKLWVDGGNLYMQLLWRKPHSLTWLSVQDGVKPQERNTYLKTIWIILSLYNKGKDNEDRRHSKVLFEAVISCRAENKCQGKTEVAGPPGLILIVHQLADCCF